LLSAWLEFFLYGYLLASDAVPSNQALQPTATRCMFTFFMIKTVLEILSRAAGSHG
jgi:hypothetical protein